ncbi:MAG: type II toxin-antitoxin system RelE/ParE family toxin [Pseudomonadota bacterium]
MRKYKIEYAKGVVKDLKGLPRDVRSKAFEIIEKDLALDPHKGRPLTGPYKGLWKYRIGDYRIIYSIIESRVVVFVLRIRHRKNVYLGIV